MIKYFYKSLRSTSLRELEDAQRGTWVYVEAPSSQDAEQLVRRFDLEPGFLEDALDEDEQPRLERQDGKSYIFVRFGYKTPEGTMGTAPLLIVFDAEHVITISPIRLPFLDNFVKGRISVATTQRAKLTLLLLSQISDQYDVSISQTTRKIKSIRSRLRGRGITNQELIDFVTIEDELNEFLSSLMPTNAALRRLLASRQLPLFEEDQDIVEDLLLNNEQSIEAARSNLKSIANIREAYSAISANNLNRTLTILTIATIVISIPSLAMGIFSLNIPLPAQHSRDTFWIIQGINLLLIGCVLYIAKKKRVF